MTEAVTTRTLKVHQYIDTAQLKKDLAYSTNELSGNMQEQASLFAFYGIEAAKAALQVDKFKLFLENVEAEVSRTERDKKAIAGEKTTEPQLAAIVTRHPRVVAARVALNEAKQVEAIGKIAVEAFRQRRDMLVQEGATSREELKGELSIAIRKENEEQSREQQDRILNRRRNNAVG